MEADTPPIKPVHRDFLHLNVSHPEAEKDVQILES